MELPNNAVIILSPAHILQVITTIFHFSFDIKFIVTNIDCLCKYLSLTNVMYVLRMTSRPKHLHLAKITFFFPREAFCGIEYAENLFVCGRGFARTPLGSSQRSPTPFGAYGASTLAHPALGSAQYT